MAKATARAIMAMDRAMDLPRLLVSIYFLSLLFLRKNYCVVDFDCPEPNGFFADPEQCDLYYECVDNLPEAKLCPDGLLFEDGNPNHENCDYPFNVNCGAREFVRKFFKAILFAT